MTDARNADRARMYMFLARTFQPPKLNRLNPIRNKDLPELIRILERLGATRELVTRMERLVECLVNADPTSLEREYEIAFEVSGGAERPANETAYAPETPQEGLTKTFQLADIAGFYRAFGVEVEPGTERADHIAAELEFMHLLAVKEALAGERAEAENIQICREGAASFLHDHLGRWCEKLRAGLEDRDCGELYLVAADVLVQFVKLDIKYRNNSSRMANAAMG